MTRLAWGLEPREVPAALLEVVRRELEESAEVKRAIDEATRRTIVLVAQAVVASLRHDGQLVLFGNGGSAADAQHLAAELVGRFTLEREALRAQALTCNAAVLTSVANDYDYTEVFSRQVRAVVRPGDVVVGLSTSGRSPNVVKGLEAARDRGAVTVAMTGAVGGPCAAVARLALAVPSRVTARIQEAHLTIGHILCGLVEQALAGPRP